MCDTRYGALAPQMNRAWTGALPVIKLGDWGSRSQRSPEEPNYEDYAKMTYSHTDLWTRLTLFLTTPDSDDPILRKFFRKRINKYSAVKGIAASALSALPTNITIEADPFTFRDTIDLIRTMSGRYMNLIVMFAVDNCDNKNLIVKLKEQYTNLMNVTVDILNSSPEFSMHQTMEALKRSAPVNPNFEITLKHNLCNGYCLQAAYEPAKYIYANEVELGFNWLLSAEKDKVALKQQREALLEEFWHKPLAEMQADCTQTLDQLISKTIEYIRMTEDLIFL